MHLQCVVAGGGPAGMTLGYSWCVPAFAPSSSKSTPTSLRLSRDTILPSTLDAMFELGILDESVFRLEMCRPSGLPRRFLLRGEGLLDTAGLKACTTSEGRAV